MKTNGEKVGNFNVISGPALMGTPYTPCLLTDAKTGSERLDTYPTNQSGKRVPDSTFVPNPGFLPPPQVSFLLASILQMSEQKASGSAWISRPGRFAM